MSDYRFENERFIINNYQKKKPFSSFLNGISGRMGIPMWTFYVNRGQCISSFGIKDKNTPMMEFSPAAIAYKDVYSRGFRTIVKKNDGKVFEVFSERSESQRMEIGINDLRIIENRDDMAFTVEYCNVPNRPFAGIVRKVTIKNVSNTKLEFEIIDGLAEILPFGITNSDYKAMGHLLRAWMYVESKKDELSYFKLNASTEDSLEVKKIDHGHFAFSFDENGSSLSHIVDINLIFGTDTSLRSPEGFIDNSVEDLLNTEMIVSNKLPCYFTGKKVHLESGESEAIYSIFGNADDISDIIKVIENENLVEFGENCFKESNKIIESITLEIETETAYPIFDQYCKQSYIDNILRGGYPIKLGKSENSDIFYLFSRKHGDQERDYNFFSLSPEFYSQGNGNFRDVNQNRRNDIYFHPEIGDHNIRLFYDLIQLDGYNPLIIDGKYYQVKEDKFDYIKSRLEDHEAFSVLDVIKSSSFSPGKIMGSLRRQFDDITIVNNIFEEIMSCSIGEYKSIHGEGYWIDHWTYNFDLIESYLYIYPDKLQELLFSQNYRFFNSSVRVLPRKSKLKTLDGKLRQFNSLERIEPSTINESCWIRGANGKDEIVTTSLLGKILCLIANKMSLLDPMGIGIEMEAGKPGWNDALNGLPHLMGSSMAEQIELYRVIDFLYKSLGMMDCSDAKVEIPEEIAELWKILASLLKANFDGCIDDLEFWDASHTNLESYRKNIIDGISGQMEVINLNWIHDDLAIMKNKLERGLKEAHKLGNGSIPTYLTYDIEVNDSSFDSLDLSILNIIDNIKVNVLPKFLEAPARQLKVLDRISARVLHEFVKGTELYDNELKMFKTSTSIENESLSIGRIRAFSPGWLERESVFLHMEYKYLLGLLKSSNWEEFFNAMKNALIPFQNPEVYGRPTTENVSFIASTVNPDKIEHGRGHFAKLSGSTAEFLNMYIIMMTGLEPFFIKDTKLHFRLKPIIKNWMFKSDGTLSFTFGGTTKITYVNKKRIDTFGHDCVKVVKMVIEYIDGEISNEGPILEDNSAMKLRDGKVRAIVAYLE